MTGLLYTRFELLRAFRNRRFFILSFGFPLVLYFLIAGPQRSNHDLAGTGISAPLYYMAGLASFGTMSSMIFIPVWPVMSDTTSVSFTFISSSAFCMCCTCCAA